jgi:hypothetical protein
MQKRPMDRRCIAAAIMERKKVHRVLFPRDPLYYHRNPVYFFARLCLLSLSLSLSPAISCSWQPWFIGCKSRWNNTPCQFLWLLHYCFFTNLQWLKSVLLFDDLSKYRWRHHEKENGWVLGHAPGDEKGKGNSKNT